MLEAGQADVADITEGRLLHYLGFLCVCPLVKVPISRFDSTHLSADGQTGRCLSV